MKTLFLGFLTVFGVFSVAGVAAEPALNAGPVDTRMPLLMPDDFSRLHVVSWRVEPAAQDAHNPLLEGEMPWDRGGVAAHGTVLKDPIDGLFKAWVCCTPAEEELKGVCTKDPQNHHLRRLCYFESRDGINWTRPKLPDSAFGEYEATNIVFDDTNNGGTQYASVSVDPDNKDWPYEMFVFRQMYLYAADKPGFTKLQHFRSKDGITWKYDYGPIQGPFDGDVCFAHPAKELDPKQRGGYVAYYRLSGRDEGSHVPPCESRQNGLAKTRQLYRAESADGKKWTNAEKIISRDERDHRDTQYMELVPHRVPGGYLGVVSVYRPITQTQNLRLATSRDGKKWWFPDRRPCLDNPPLGDYGGGMLWQSKNLVVDGGRLYIYYAGMEGLHMPIMDTRGAGFQQIGLDTVFDRHHGFLPFNSALCRASWRADRLYALVPAAGGPTIGSAVTTTRELEGKQMRINFRARPAKKAKQPGLDEGYVQVELLDKNDEPLTGFARKDCPPLRGDHRALVVEWKGGRIAPKEATKAKFYLKRAFLYGFEALPPKDSFSSL